MAPKNSIIIDTDPGTDDILAILLALSAPAEDMEVLLLSITYGNIGLKHCVRNVVTLFNVIHQELEWRKASNIDQGFPALASNKPVVAIGADHPLEDEDLAADYFHGLDGLHGVHEAHPHLTPDAAWEQLFSDNEMSATAAGDPKKEVFHNLFIPSKQPAHKEILKTLRERPANTVSIVVIGPMTNVALAAAEDPETFLRAKELVVMGGAVGMEGNITPVAEFNTFADPIAAARVFALTSPSPSSTMPPAGIPGLSSRTRSLLPDYPPSLSRRAKLTLFPVDITTRHCLDRELFSSSMARSVEAGSPLSTWVNHFIARSFEHLDSIEQDGSHVGYALHDPLTIWYLLTRDDQGWEVTSPPEDIRIETVGQWTRGMHVVDRRSLRLVDGDAHAADNGGWLSRNKGNRVHRVLKSPGADVFQRVLLRVFGNVQ